MLKDAQQRPPPARQNYRQYRAGEERRHRPRLARDILQRLRRVRRGDDLQQSRVEHAVILPQRKRIHQREQRARRPDQTAAAARQKAADKRHEQRKPRHAHGLLREQPCPRQERERRSLEHLPLNQRRHIRQTEHEKQRPRPAPRAQQTPKHSPPASLPHARASPAGSRFSSTASSARQPRSTSSYVASKFPVYQGSATSRSSPANESSR